LGELDELQETKVQVEVRDSANSKSSNKGPVNGFKRVATLQSEKLDDTRKEPKQTNNETTRMNQSNNQPKWTFQQPKQQEQVPSQPEMPNASMGTANQTTTGQNSLGW